MKVVCIVSLVCPPNTYVTPITHTHTLHTERERQRERERERERAEKGIHQTICVIGFVLTIHDEK